MQIGLIKNHLHKRLCTDFHAEFDGRKEHLAERQAVVQSLLSEELVTQHTHCSHMAAMHGSEVNQFKVLAEWRVTTGCKHSI